MIMYKDCKLKYWSLLSRSCGEVFTNYEPNSPRDGPSSISLSPFDLKPWESFLNGIAHHPLKPQAYDTND